VAIRSRINLPDDLAPQNVKRRDVAAIIWGVPVVNCSLVLQATTTLVARHGPASRGCSDQRSSC
jgi:hypothetical protein